MQILKERRSVALQVLKNLRLLAHLRGGDRNDISFVIPQNPFRRLGDVEFRIYDGLPHNICDAVPDRCAADLREFLRRRFE